MLTPKLTIPNAKLRGVKLIAQATAGSWSILHISDTQFGKYHRFSGGPDSLAKRLLEDLVSLRDTVPPVRLVVLSGDITERALPSEFREATAFLKGVLEQLALTTRDVLFVPGNHDVNWKDCEAHFNQREARGLEPVAPFKPKWSKYASFRRALTGETTLHSVVHRPDLRLSAVLINSTVRESHQQHFGWCGEDQLRELAGQLREGALDLRIAILHHNVRRGATDDNENLLDEREFTRILGPYLTLVLHGHTHNGRRDYLSDGTLVLSTGSAAVSSAYRPDEVDNQYQVISFNDGQLHRWARRYAADEKRFVADSRIGPEAHPGRESIPIVGTANNSSARGPVEGVSRKARLRLGQYDEDETLRDGKSNGL